MSLVSETGLGAVVEGLGSCSELLPGRAAPSEGLDKTLPAPSFLKSSASFSKISVKFIVLSMLCFLQVRYLNTSKGENLPLWFSDR